MTFTGMLGLQIYCGKTQEKLESDCLERHCERSLKFCDWLRTQVSLFLLTGEAGIVNIQGCGMHGYLS